MSAFERRAASSLERTRLDDARKLGVVPITVTALIAGATPEDDVIIEETRAVTLVEFSAAFNGHGMACLAQVNESVRQIVNGRSRG